MQMASSRELISPEVLDQLKEWFTRAEAEKQKEIDRRARQQVPSNKTVEVVWEAGDFY